jgi:hypothetical protein
MFERRIAESSIRRVVGIVLGGFAANQISCLLLPHFSVVLVQGQKERPLPSAFLLPVQ